MIKTSIAVILFIIWSSVLVASQWGTGSWWQGVAVGIALGLLWHANNIVTAFLGLLGIFLLSATAIGLIGIDMSIISRTFFNGMALAMPLGFALSAWWRWKIFRPHLVKIARIENETWILRLLNED